MSAHTVAQRPQYHRECRGIRAATDPDPYVADLNLDRSGNCLRLRSGCDRRRIRVNNRGYELEPTRFRRSSFRIS